MDGDALCLSWKERKGKKETCGRRGQQRREKADKKQGQKPAYRTELINYTYARSAVKRANEKKRGKDRGTIQRQRNWADRENAPIPAAFFQGEKILCARCNSRTKANVLISILPTMENKSNEKKGLHFNLRENVQIV